MFFAVATAFAAGAATMLGCGRHPTGDGNERVPIEVEARRPLGQARNAGVALVTANGDARDVTATVSSGDGGVGTTWVAASAAVVSQEADGRQRVVTWADGLSTSLPTAACAAGAIAIIGGAEGSLTLIEGDTSRSVRFGGAGISDLSCEGARAFVATHDGLYEWTVDAAFATRRLKGGDVTALAPSPRGLVAGLGDGSVVLVGADGGTALLAPASDDPVTALAFAGGTLWVGRAASLDRIDGGRVVRARGDVHVSALLGDGTRLLVGTPDGGVLALALDETGGERRVLGDTHVARLRRIGERAVAVADGAIYAVADGGPILAPPPRGLADLAVARVAIAGAEVWVGGAHGVDVLDGRGAWLRREAPGENILGLEPRPDSGEMVVGTTAGGLVIGAQQPSRPSRPIRPIRIGEREGLLGARVVASTSLAGVTAYATDLGVTIIDEIGVAVRLTCGEALPPGGVSAVAWGPRGRLYIGTAGGLTVARAGRVESTYATGAVLAMTVGAAGVYVATPSGVEINSCRAPTGRRSITTRCSTSSRRARGRTSRSASA